MNLDFHLSFPIGFNPRNHHREVNGLNTTSCATALRELSRTPAGTAILQGRIVVCRTNPCNPLGPEDPISQERAQRRAGSTGEQCKANRTCLDKNQNPNPDSGTNPSESAAATGNRDISGLPVQELQRRNWNQRRQGGERSQCGVFFLKSHLENQFCSDLLKISLSTMKERRPTP